MPKNCFDAVTSRWKDHLFVYEKTSLDGLLSKLPDFLVHSPFCGKYSREKCLYF